MRFAILGRAAGLLALSGLTVAAAAQTGSGQPAGGQASGSQAGSAQAGAAQAGGGQPAPGGTLDIPREPTIVGSGTERNVARATAIVNDEIITQTDIVQRMALELVTRRLEGLTPDQLELMRGQVFRALVDETLQIQGARENKIKIEQKDIKRYYDRYAQSFGHTPDKFPDYLRTIGSSERSVKRQIEGELSWRELQRAKLPRVSVANTEVQELLDQLNATRGSNEYRVAEIYLTPETPSESMDQVRAKAAQVIEEVRSRGAGVFPVLAQRLSKASTAARGGDLGWVRPDRLPGEIAAVVQAMPVGGISNPIQLPSGYSVVLLVDSRQVLVSNPRDAQVSLMQMSIELPPGTTEAQARARADQLARATETMGGCGRAAETASRLGAELVANEVRVRELPPFVQQTILNLSVGQANAPFGSLERISVLVLCGRDDPQPSAAPTFAGIADQIENERMTRQAQRFLRDLRRDAVIEYR